MIQRGTSYPQYQPTHEAARAAAGALEKAGVSKADAVIVFTSAKYRRHYAAILKTLRQVTGAKTIAGPSGEENLSGNFG